MLVRVQDIPQEGLELDFSLELEKLGDRVNANQTDTLASNVTQPLYDFISPLPVKLKLFSDGRTVEAKGQVTASFNTLCSRCTAQANYCLELPFNIIVKPKLNAEEEEDVGYALYLGEDLDCNSMVEDLVVLNLPAYVLCSDSCKGLCPICGKNLNSYNCNCDKNTKKADFTKDNPFLKLKDLKIN